MKKFKLSLPVLIMIGMVLGIALGIPFQKKPEFAVQYITPFGTLFLNLIKMIVVPVVLCSIISGVISMKDIRKCQQGRLGFQPHRGSPGIRVC